MFCKTFKKIEIGNFGFAVYLPKTIRYCRSKGSGFLPMENVLFNETFVFSWSFWGPLRKMYFLYGKNTYCVLCVRIYKHSAESCCEQQLGTVGRLRIRPPDTSTDTVDGRRTYNTAVVLMLILYVIETCISQC